jgi:thiosulfate reductase cytochrome b subunit
MDSAPKSAKTHSWIVRLMHWLNAFAFFILLFSGWQIYNAAPLFAGLTFPAWSLGGWLGGALLWHFAAMWLLFFNFILYLGYGFLFKHFRKKLYPISWAGLTSEIKLSFKLRLKHEAYDKYNNVQKIFYISAFTFLLIIILSGLYMWKPVQFHFLSYIFYSFPVARYVHFFAMAGLMLFALVHIIMVVIHPRTLWLMIRG